MIEAVIFDMDGVLIDSGEPHLESWLRLADEYGLSITRAQFLAMFGRTSREIIRELFGETDSQRIAALDERKEAVYRDIVRANVPEMPGARRLVERVVAMGLRCAVGSSGPRENVMLACDALQMNGHLTAAVSGADVVNGKPDPEVFLLAATRMSVKPAACAVVEDAPAGIEAARRAGMRVIGLSSTHDAAALHRADVVVKSLEEAGGAIAGWAGKR